MGIRERGRRVNLCDVTSIGKGKHSRRQRRDPVRFTSTEINSPSAGGRFNSFVSNFGQVEGIYSAEPTVVQGSLGATSPAVSASIGQP